jgi:hypothetical protein
MRASILPLRILLALHVSERCGTWCRITARCTVSSKIQQRPHSIGRSTRFVLISTQHGDYLAKHLLHQVCTLHTRPLPLGRDAIRKTPEARAEGGRRRVSTHVRVDRCNVPMRYTVTPPQSVRGRDTIPLTVMWGAQDTHVATVRA